MDPYKLLKDSIAGIGPRQIAIYQGIVNSVNGHFCEIQVGSMAIPGVRLRSSELDDDGELLLTPKLGSAVTVGSLSGDLSSLVVIAMDHVASIKASGTITINGGKLGGMVSVEALTKKLNEFVKIYNNHTHADKGVVTTSHAGSFNSGDYEDNNVKH